MIDLSLLKNLMSGDEKLVARFILIFKTQVPAQVRQLPGLCENQEWEELSTSFHSLKTQFSYLGITEFAEQMREMEENVDNGDTSSIAAGISQFIKAFDQFMQAEFPENSL
ncbi:Hpt domain-containing protein [Dyadobacter sp. Leaf189]|uniref:Hpt domain-containing protein n=1 Tax=Dyadobacter sp. Leaf189 TaxID=1736295 RepID=UPI0006F3EAF3|nr:Hpt domain-containing protein [Dyadobacter sp. Leaf189]KQS30828.1 hypothetical protein ASG33_10650 [Dyadobacter sp. Leaf189]